MRIVQEQDISEGVSKPTFVAHASGKDSISTPVQNTSSVASYALQQTSQLTTRMPLSFSLEHSNRHNATEVTRIKWFESIPEIIAFSKTGDGVRGASLYREERVAGQPLLFSTIKKAERI